MVLDFFFPRQCLKCRKNGVYLCIGCLKKVSLAKQICPLCKRPSVDGMTHIKCKRLWAMDALVSIWRYEGVLRKALLSLKYKFAAEIAKELANHTADYLKTEKLFLPKKATLVTVPLHWYRGNWRGFNQSEEIGKLVARRMGWQLVPDLLIRKKAARPQAGLRGRERRVNVKGVFSLNPAYTLEPKTYTLILFDDIWTTGATLKEAAKVLKRNGVKEIWSLTIAR